MLWCFVFGALFLVSGGLNAFGAHDKGKETQTTLLMGSKSVTPAEAATPAPASNATFSGTINFPPMTLDASGRLMVASAYTAMGFEICLKAISLTASNVGVAPLNIVETSDVRIVRFPTSEGSIMLTCSRPDQRLVVTTSPSRG
jgi:hypothetical protein